jgi:hypothetical protein
LNIKEVLNGKAAQKINSSAYDEGFEVNDDNDWGDEWGEEQEKEKDFTNFDYKNQNLNKLGDKALKEHK